MIKSLIFFLCLLCINCFGNTQVINIYTWPGYLPQLIVKQFEKKTGIHVNLQEYNNNATLYTKLRVDPQAGYDIIIPSSYTVERMREHGMLLALNKNKLPLLKDISPNLLNKPFDPHNQYSIPYLWGTTGIVVNSRYINPNSIHRWSDLWHPQFRHKLMLLNDMHDVFSMALMSLHYSPNDKNPQHIKQAYLLLTELLPNILAFNSDITVSAYADGDAVIGMGYNGDTLKAYRENKYLKFIYPNDGCMFWIDNLAIPKYAPHVNNAYRFINFVMQPNIAKAISMHQGYSSPNIIAMQQMPNTYKNNPMFNPPKSILKHGKFQRDLGGARKIYEHYWELLKLSA